MNGLIVRTMPAGLRNGLPETRGYVYRGTGEDIMPWAVTDDYSVADRGTDRHPRGPCLPGAGTARRLDGIWGGTSVKERRLMRRMGLAA